MVGELMDKPWGMHSLAWDKYKLACFQANINPARVVQTIGNAPASAGYHAKDGIDPADGNPYCAAVDLSVKHPDVLTPQQIHTLQMKLANNGFISWWRHTGSFTNNQHIHAVYCGVNMKIQLRQQVHDWFKGRDGLVDEGDDSWWQGNMTNQQENVCRALFLAHNPAVN